MRLDRTLALGGLVAASLLTAACSAPTNAAPRPAPQRCGVGLAGTTYLLRLIGPHAHAQCAAQVKKSKPLGGYWSTRTGTGLVLICQARYRDGVVHQIYAASKDDFYGSFGCSIQADDVKAGKAHALAPKRR